MSLRDENDKKDEYTLLASDLFEILRRKKGLLLLSFLLVALSCFSYFLTSVPTYKAEASFRDKAKLSSGLQNELLLGLVGEKHDSEAASAMKSTFLNERVVRRLHWNGFIEENKDTFPLIENGRKNLLNEWAHLQGKKEIALEEIPLPIIVTTLDTTLETPIFIQLHFIDENRFTAEGPKSRVTAHLDDLVLIDGASFTLNRSDKEPLFGRNFTLAIQNPTTVAEEMTKQISAKPDLDNRNIILLTLKTRDRKSGALYLNNLMEEYQSFLKEEHIYLSKKQLTYLDDREKEISERLSEKVLRQAHSFSKEISQSGFLDTKAELEFLTRELSALKSRLFELSLNEKRLKKLLHTPFATFDRISVHLFDSDVINKNIDELRRIKELHDLADLKLAQFPAKISAVPAEEDRFSALTLPAAKEWVDKIGHDCARTECAAKEIAFHLKQLEQPEFQISSLAPFIDDPIAKERLFKASNLSVALGESNNRSTREIERLKEELQNEKTFLRAHLKETEHLQQERAKSIAEDAHHVWKKIRTLAESETYHLQKQLKDFVAARLSTQEAEKELALRQASEIERRIALLPQNWVHETLFEHLLDSDRKMRENISTLIESKNISSNLEVIQSSPLDLARSQLMPLPPKLLLAFIGGGLIGTLFTAALVVIHGLSKRTPLTPKNLRANGYTLLGLIPGSSPLRELNFLIEEMKAKRIILFAENEEKLLRLQTYFENCFILDAKSPAALDTWIATAKADTQEKNFTLVEGSWPLFPLALLRQFDCIVLPFERQTLQELHPLFDSIPKEKIIFMKY